jgi:hypothetical protein
LFEGIIGPKNLCDAPVSLGIFHHLRTALEAKTPARVRIDDVELDSGIVPEVLNGAWRGEIGKPEFVITQYCYRALGREVRLAVGVTVAA